MHTLFASKNAAGQQIMGSHGSHQVLSRVSLPILGPLLFLPHTLGIFRQCLPCGLFRRVRCDPAMLMSSADCSYTRLCGQAHLCVQLPEELLLQPCPLSPQPCHGAWCWLASPSPSASSSLMRSSNVLQLSLQPLYCRLPQLHTIRKVKGYKMSEKHYANNRVQSAKS